MKGLIRKEKSALAKISGIYIFLLIILFPLMADKTGYFHIFECKKTVFLILACSYIGICILIFLYFLLFKKVKYYKQMKMDIIQWLAIGFLLINIISCFTSPFFKKYNLFMGTDRNEGLIMISLYVVSFLFISWFAEFKKKYLIYFTITALLISPIVILQYFGFNPLNMYQKGVGFHNVSFVTTIGNIDIVSALYCILLTITFGTYVFLDDNKKWVKVLQILTILLGFWAIWIIDVQSGKVAFLGTLIIIFPFLISNNKRLSKFLTMSSTILASYCISMVLKSKYDSHIKLMRFNFNFNYVAILLIIVCILLIVAAKIIKNKEYDFGNNKKIFKYLYLGIFIGGLLCLLGIYLYDFKSGILYEMHEIMHGNFDDNFGTYRIFLWKRTLPLIKEYPLIGSGPDTFAVRFMRRYTADVAAIGPLSVNDTAANVYLTMTINIGIVGLLSYLLFVFFNLKKGIKKIDNFSFILLIAIVCFLIQDFFNLWVLIVTPIFWLLLGLHYRCICDE